MCGCREGSWSSGSRPDSLAPSPSPFDHHPLLLPPAALARSILSSRRWTLVSTNTDTGPLRSYITRPLSFSVALYLSSSGTILFHRVLPRALRPLPGLSTRLVLLSPLLRPLSSPRALLQRVQRPLPVYTPLGVQHLPTWPRHNCIRTRPTVDPVHTPRLPASTTVTTGTALNLSPRTTLLHYFERLIRNYYLNRDTNG